MPDTYLLKVAGLERILPVIRISPSLSIASFVMPGDTELVEACARALVDHPDFPESRIDILACPEAKAVPLTHAVARILGIDYVVVRKSVKAYMENPLTAVTTSITTSGEQQLVINGIDAARLKDRNIAVIDDVVSTGGSLKSLETLLERTGGTIVVRAAVLLEEAGYAGQDLIYLEELPVFPD